MNRTEFVAAVAGDADMPQAVVDAVLTAAEHRLAQILFEGGEVELRRLGKFGVKHRAGGEGRNPRTGEKIDIAPSRQAHFRPSVALKRALNVPSPSILRYAAGGRR